MSDVIHLAPVIHLAEVRRARGLPPPLLRPVSLGALDWAGELHGCRVRFRLEGYSGTVLGRTRLGDLLIACTDGVKRLATERALERLDP